MDNLIKGNWGFQLAGLSRKSPIYGPLLYP